MVIFQASTFRFRSSSGREMADSTRQSLMPWLIQGHNSILFNIVGQPKSPEGGLCLFDLLISNTVFGRCLNFDPELHVTGGYQLAENFHVKVGPFLRGYLADPF